VHWSLKLHKLHKKFKIYNFSWKNTKKTKKCKWHNNKWFEGNLLLVFILLHVKSSWYWWLFFRLCATCLSTFSFVFEIQKPCH
jgi:hypothetical protein